MVYTNTRQTFEQVFTEIVVPTIMEEVKATDLAKNAVEWIETVSSLLSTACFPLFPLL